jgi:hypothetical protein
VLPNAFSDYSCALSESKCVFFDYRCVLSESKCVFSDYRCVLSESKYVFSDYHNVSYSPLRSPTKRHFAFSDYSFSIIAPQTAIRRA